MKRKVPAPDDTRNIRYRDNSIGIKAETEDSNLESAFQSLIDHNQLDEEQPSIPPAQIFIASKTVADLTKWTLYKSNSLPFSINVVNCLKRAENKDLIVVGSSLGHVWILSDDLENKQLIETKGEDVTSLLTCGLFLNSELDIVIGDSKGDLAINHQQQIFSRRGVGSSITCLCFYTNSLGDYEILAGDANGYVTSFSVFDKEYLWRIQIYGNQSMFKLPNTRRFNVAISCMACVNIRDDFGGSCNSLLVCDGSFFIHFVKSGAIVKSIATPCSIVDMCVGNFLPNEAGQQVMLAGNDSNIYLLDQYKLHLYAVSDYYITQIEAVDNRVGSNMILCAGHFCGLHVYQAGKLVDKIPTEDWVSSFTLGDVDNDGSIEIIAGCVDSTIHIFRLGEPMEIEQGNEILNKFFSSKLKSNADLDIKGFVEIYEQGDEEGEIDE